MLALSMFLGTSEKATLNKNIYISFCLCIALILVLIGLEPKISKRKLCFPATILVVIGFYLWILYFQEVSPSNSEPKSAFNQGYLLCFCQMLILLNCSSRCWIAVLDLAIFSIRVAYFHEVSDALIQVILDLLVLYTLQAKEQRNRRVLAVLDHQKVKYDNLMEFINCYCDEQILILHKSLDEVLLMNESFKSMFHSITSFKRINVEDNPHYEDANFKTVLENIRAKDISNPVTLKVSFTEYEGGRMYFKVEISRIIYGKEEGYLIVFNQLDKSEFSLVKYKDGTESLRITKHIDDIINDACQMARHLGRQINIPFFRKAYIQQTIFRIIDEMFQIMIDFEYLRAGKFEHKGAGITVQNFFMDLKSTFDCYCAERDLKFHYNTQRGTPREIWTCEVLFSHIMTILVYIVLKQTSKGVGLTFSLHERNDKLGVFRVCEEEDVEEGKKQMKQQESESLSTSVSQTDENIQFLIRIADQFVKKLSHGQSTLEVISHPKALSFSFAIEIVFFKSHLGGVTETDSNTIFTNGEQETPTNQDPLGHESPRLQSKLSQNYGVKFLENLEHFNAPREATFGLRPTLDTQADENTERYLLEDNLSSTRKTENWILVVDNEPLNVLLYKKLALSQGYQVETAKDGEEALKTLIRYSKLPYFFDFILLDCQMKGVDCFQLARKVKELINKGEISKTCIVGISNKDGEEIQRKAKKAEMDFFVVKPLDLKSFTNILALGKATH